MILALIFTACGGGGGNGGADVGASTTTVSAGPITGLGSIIVNGQKFGIEGADIVLEEGQGTEANLRIGMFVTVKGTIDDKGVTSVGTVVFEDILEGPIENISLADTTLTILGQTVMVDGLTVIEASGQTGSLLFEDLAVNDVVEVSGQIDANGIIRASRLERKSGVFVPGVTEVEIKGTISNFNADTKTFTIETDVLLVDYNGVTPEGTLFNGVFVEVKGRQATLGGPLQATKVEVKTPGLAAGAGTRVEVEGFVTQVISATTFVVNNQPVHHTAQTVFENGTAANIAINVKLEVEGSVDDSGALVADKVSFRQSGGGNVRIAAPVEAVDTTNNRVTLLGLPVQVNALTVVKDSSQTAVRNFSVGNIVVGDRLEIRGFVNGQDTIVASRLERQNPDDEVSLQGPVGTINTSNLTILGLVAQTEEQTEFEDANDNPLTAADFFAQVQVGDLVKAKGILQNDGSILAEEVELEGEDD
jgi:hypothetical protein